MSTPASPDMAVSTAKGFTKQLLELDLKLSFQRKQITIHPYMYILLVHHTKVFDMALNHRSKGTQAMQSILNVLSIPAHYNMGTELESVDIVALRMQHTQNVYIYKHAVAYLVMLLSPFQTLQMHWLPFKSGNVVPKL